MTRVGHHCTKLLAKDALKLRRSEFRIQSDFPFKNDGRQILVDAGVHTDVFNKASWTPLHEAAFKGNTQIVKVGIAFSLMSS